jgi:hypothetical protein
MAKSFAKVVEADAVQGARNTATEAYHTIDEGASTAQSSNAPPQTLIAEVFNVV